MQVLESDEVITGRLEIFRGGSPHSFAWVVDEQGRVICSIEELMAKLGGQKIQVTQYRDERGGALATVIVATSGGTAP